MRKERMVALKGGFAIVILLLLCFPAVFTNSIFGYFPVIVTLIFIVLNRVYLVILKKKTGVSSRQYSLRVVRGESVEIPVELYNASRLVCVDVRGEVYARNYFGRISSSVTAFLTVNSRSSSRFSFSLDTEHVGVYTAGIRNIRLFDFIGLFNTRIPAEYEADITVLPKSISKDDMLKNINISDDPKAASYKEENGFDYTGVREYAYGDSMKKIHWKLSAHCLNYMTKISEVSLMSDMEIIADTVSEDLRENELLMLNDGIMEISAALIRLAVNLEMNYRVVYADKNNDVCIEDYSGEPDMEKFIYTIRTIGPKKRADESSAAELIKLSRERVEPTSNTAVVSSCITDELLRLLITEAENGQNPMFFYVVQPVSDSSERKKASDKVRILDEYGIYYEVVSA